MKRILVELKKKMSIEDGNFDEEEKEEEEEENETVNENINNGKNGEYLLEFLRKEGDIQEFYDHFLEIRNIIINELLDIIN